MTCRWRRRWNFPVQALLYGRFTATNLHPALARPGQLRSVGSPPSTAVQDWEETFRFLGHPRAADPKPPTNCQESRLSTTSTTQRVDQS